MGVSAFLLITARESTVTLNKSFNFGKGPDEFGKLCVLDSSQSQVCSPVPKSHDKHF